MSPHHVSAISTISDHPETARRALSEGDIVQSLEQFWTSNISAPEDDITPAILDSRNEDLTRSALNMLQTLGPLIFPIHRASLLRKRLLLISQPPLLPVCDFGTLPRSTQAGTYD